MHWESLRPNPEAVYARVLKEIFPQKPIPEIRVEVRPYAGANAQIRLHAGVLRIKMADTLAKAPDEVLEALAWILLSKLYRQPVPRNANERYKRYLSGREVRQVLDKVRQARGRKQVESPKGEYFDLDVLFDELNFKYFFGLMVRPVLGWSPRASRTLLGHYDPSHNTIVLSRILDRKNTPKLAVEYVLFHEMLHVKYPVEHRGTRRCVHTKDFKQAEKAFEKLREAKAMLRLL
jgi:hypothetical protein